MNLTNKIMLKFNKQLFKKDTKGKIRMIHIYTDSNGTLIQESGIEGTENPIKHSKVCKGKNIGKSNETSPEQQAINEAESLCKDKLTKGYFNTIQEAETIEVILPMLAKEYKKENHKIDYNDSSKSQVFAQPKLDGMRCLAHINRYDISADNSGNYIYEVIFKSREGKIIQNMHHIEKDLLTLSTHLNPNGFPHIIDGELYIHGEDFQTNMECIKKYTKDITEKVQFHIYDKINPEIYEHRRAGLSFIEGLSNALKLNSLAFVHSFQINSEEMLNKFHSQYLSLGYEGTMVRLGRGQYKINGRSSDLLKYKDFIDISCKIVSITSAKQRSEWARPVVEYNGKQFACGLKMSHDARKEMLLNKENYIGKIAEVRFFEFSSYGVPRFPVIHGIRLDK